MGNPKDGTKCVSGAPSLAQTKEENKAKVPGRALGFHQGRQGSNPPLHFHFVPSPPSLLLGRSSVAEPYVLGKLDGLPADDASASSTSCCRDSCRIGGVSDSHCVEEARRAAWDLIGVKGSEPSSWDALAKRARPPVIWGSGEKFRTWFIEGGTSALGGELLFHTLQGRCSSGLIATHSRRWVGPARHAASRLWIVTSSVCTCYVSTIVSSSDRAFFPVRPPT